MQFRKIATTLAAATLLAAAGSAYAAGTVSEYYPFSEIMSMKMMDKNKDGMVSKKEFMDMMSMAWDMNAKKMTVKGDKMTTDQFNQLLQYLKAGG
ncbi:MAG TPA: EF-hand domain-containing protein [Ramlibacter sp.]